MKIEELPFTYYLIRCLNTTGEDEITVIVSVTFSTMIIKLSALDPLCQSRDFSFQLDKIEVGFEVVNQIAAQNNTLLKVQLIDQGHYTPLPIEAFDGAPLAAPIQKLEQEWTQLLEPSLQTTKQPTDEEFLNWARRQVYRYENNIVEIEQMINAFHKLIQESENFSLFKKQPLKSVDHFKFMLERCELKLGRASIAHELAVKRLGELVDR